MSQIDSILGLPALEILTFDPGSNQMQVWAKPKRRPASRYCHSGHVRIKATHTRTLEHTRASLTRFFCCVLNVDVFD